MPPRMKIDRDPLGGLADMFGQMPGNFEKNNGFIKLKNQLNFVSGVLRVVRICVLR